MPAISHFHIGDKLKVRVIDPTKIVIFDYFPRGTSDLHGISQVYPPENGVNISFKRKQEECPWSPAVFIGVQFFDQSNPTYGYLMSDCRFFKCHDGDEIIIS